MHTTIKLQPTLWRTCRAIANPTRLNIFAFLLKHPGQSVTAVAARFEISLSGASEHLRVLESRGLLQAQRRGKWVKYRVAPANETTPGSSLAAAMRAEFQRDYAAAENIFKLATAFTHPRRIEIFRALRSGPKAFEQLRVACKVSLWVLYGHLKKLEARGFVRQQDTGYATTVPMDRLRRELARLAVSGASG